VTIGSAGAEFVVFRPSEIAASVALAAIGECSSSVIERAATSCNYLDKVIISELDVPTKPYDTYHWMVSSESRLVYPCFTYH
jgi:hypothetical protein